MLADTTFTITDTLPMPWCKEIEENSIQLVLLKEGRTPTKVEFVFELLSAVVRPDGEIANTTMPSIPIVSTVCRKNSVDEVGDLLVAFVEVRSNAGMGNAGESVLLEIPVIHDHYEKHCFGSAKRKQRKGMQRIGWWKKMSEECGNEKPTCHNNQIVALVGR